MNLYNVNMLVRTSFLIQWVLTPESWLLTRVQGASFCPDNIHTSTSCQVGQYLKTSSKDSRSFSWSRIHHFWSSRIFLNFFQVILGFELACQTVVNYWDVCFSMHPSWCQYLVWSIVLWLSYHAPNSKRIQWWFAESYEPGRYCG